MTHTILPELYSTQSTDNYISSKNIIIGYLCHTHLSIEYNRFDIMLWTFENAKKCSD